MNNNLLRVKESGSKMVEKKMKYLGCPIEDCKQVFKISSDEPAELEKLQDEVKMHLERDHTLEELVDALAPMMQKVKNIKKIL